jgi:hypothetical protein
MFTSAHVTRHTVCAAALMIAVCGSLAPRVPADARPAADSPARAAAKPCVPAHGLVVPVTIRRNLTNGSEVTEPLSGDGYRITRCDNRRHTTISMTVLPIVDTGGKILLLPRELSGACVFRRLQKWRP